MLRQGGPPAESDCDGAGPQPSRPDRTILRSLVVLGIAQIVGWGTLGLPAVIGRSMAADLHMSIEAVFAGTSVRYVVTGLLAPLLAQAFTRFGARRVLIAGTVLASPGFVLLALSQGPAAYFAAWAILGIAGSASLTTAAHIMLNEIAGRKAKSAIGALMLVTGLSNSIFWPTTAFLSEMVGWRATCLVYAAAVVLVCLPLYSLGLPRRARMEDESASSTAPAATTGPGARKSTFYLIVSAVILNAFVTIGVSATLIELLRAEGLSLSTAVAFGSAVGVVEIAARAIDFLGRGRWDGITTGLIAGIAIPAAMLLLMATGGTTWSIAAFILLYGLGSGAFAVARATMPLVFYDKAAYARALSHIALPLNLISALAPPVLVGLLAHSGSKALLGLACLCSFAAWLILLLLRRRRPAAAVANTG